MRIGGHSVTDINALIKELRDLVDSMKTYGTSAIYNWNIPKEAADALEKL